MCREAVAPEVYVKNVILGKGPRLSCWLFAMRDSFMVASGLGKFWRDKEGLLRLALFLRRNSFFVDESSLAISKDAYDLECYRAFFKVLF